MPATRFAAALFLGLVSAPQATLLAYLISVPIGLLILAPSLYLLYWTFNGELDPELLVGGQE